jgi:hypothetical protein
MKKRALLVAAILIAMPPFSTTGLAKSVRARSSTSLQQPLDPKLQTFTGTILKDGEKFVLNDAANKLSYALDDGKKASAYEGKKVKVTGTVDMANNMIHVETIQEIA